MIPGRTTVTRRNFLRHTAAGLGMVALGSLLVASLKPWTPLAQLPSTALAQLAAIGAAALFAAANRTPIFSALFVFTLQGDPLLLPALLLSSASSVALAERWRGPTWNEFQQEGL